MFALCFQGNGVGPIPNISGVANIFDFKPGYCSHKDLKYKYKKWPMPLVELIKV